MTQLPFDGHVGPRDTDPETSWEAAFANLGAKAVDRRSALRSLYATHSLTDFELGDEMNRVQSSAGKRRGELRDLGLAEWTGEHRPSPSGSPARVWRITPRGMRVHEELTRREKEKK